MKTLNRSMMCATFLHIFNVFIELDALTSAPAQFTNGLSTPALRRGSKEKA
jgi:hypothetical protein